MENKIVDGNTRKVPQGRIEAEWLDYKLNVIPATAPDIQFVESRRAFYAGALAMYNQLIKMVAGKEKEDEKELNAEAMYKELIRFNEGVQKGIY